MKRTLKRICELQPQYSAQNTPAMQARGKALRNELVPSFEALRSQFSLALGPFGEDVLIDASDGIGRKTELPWIRICSQSMAPKPTEGFYCVVHFSTDGSALHVTVGCGSSRFFHGYSVVLPDTEIDVQTDWARSVVLEKLGTLAPFEDTHNFGATRRLPLSFQRATAFSKRIAYGDIDDTDIEAVLIEAVKRLRFVYDAQATGRDVSPADQAEIEVEAVVNPQRRHGVRQGYALPAPAPPDAAEEPTPA